MWNICESSFNSLNSILKQILLVSYSCMEYCFIYFMILHYPCASIQLQNITSANILLSIHGMFRNCNQDACLTWRLFAGKSLVRWLPSANTTTGQRTPVSRTAPSLSKATPTRLLWHSTLSIPGKWRPRSSSCDHQKATRVPFPALLRVGIKILSRAFMWGDFKTCELLEERRSRC